MGYPEPIFSKPETGGHSLNQSPKLGGCLILKKIQ
jgi:hypothetical protein